jgi:hypothetical protein
MQSFSTNVLNVPADRIGNQRWVAGTDADEPAGD